MNTLAQLRSGQLAGARRLDLSEGLCTFPPEIFDLADTLEVLNLSGNALDNLPDDLPRLHRLSVIFCSDNRFTRLPEVLGRCPRLSMVGFKANQIDTVPEASLPPTLRWLILTDNRIAQLPEALGRCTRLEKLMLAGNRLQSLPDSLTACQALALLRVSANELTALPAWLWSMPKLAWLAVAGNPVMSQRAPMPPHDHAQAIPWAELTLHEVLGQGASGVIHRADWHRPGHTQSVAVKLFKGAVTSDGWPQSEMAACLAAGQHPHVIPVLGRVQAHPQGTPGLVMPLIDPAFKVLAQPPTLASCSRDVYAPGTQWTLSQALSLATQTASALQHLHCRGLMHGDFYGHNLLWHPDRSVLLGDFGAACLFDPGDGVLAAAFQALEVRAWGCLLEELLQHLAPAGADQPAQARAVSALHALQHACVSPSPGQRPDWSSVMATLQPLTQALA